MDIDTVFIKLMYHFKMKPVFYHLIVFTSTYHLNVFSMKLIESFLPNKNMKHRQAQYPKSSISGPAQSVGTDLISRPYCWKYRWE